MHICLYIWSFVYNVYRYRFSTLVQRFPSTFTHPQPITKKKTYEGFSGPKWKPRPFDPQTLEVTNTPLKINMEHNSLEVLFRSCSLSKWMICRFQPLIFQGLVFWPSKKRSLLPFIAKEQLLAAKALRNVAWPWPFLDGKDGSPESPRWSTEPRTFDGWMFFFNENLVKREKLTS